MPITTGIRTMANTSTTLVNGSMTASPLIDGPKWSIDQRAMIGNVMIAMTELMTVTAMLSETSP